mgnify:CR=1 FL=1
MVKDIELIMNGLSPLYEKKIVIWGCGLLGEKCYEQLIELGISAADIFLCDSDINKKGTRKKGHIIYSPREIKEFFDVKNYLFVISVENVLFQKEILSTIEMLEMGDVDIYTGYGIKYGLYYNQKDERMPLETKNKQYKLYCDRYYKNNYKERRLSYFTFMPIHNEMYLVYQPGKVGSSTIHKSLKAIGKYTLHTHEYLICYMIIHLLKKWDRNTMQRLFL